MHVTDFIYKKTDFLVPKHFLSSRLFFLFLLIHGVTNWLKWINILQIFGICLKFQAPGLWYLVGALYVTAGICTLNVVYNNLPLNPFCELGFLIFSHATQIAIGFTSCHGLESLRRDIPIKWHKTCSYSNKLTITRLYNWMFVQVSFIWVYAWIAELEMGECFGKGWRTSFQTVILIEIAD